MERSRSFPARLIFLAIAARLVGACGGDGGSLPEGDEPVADAGTDRGAVASDAAPPDSNASQASPASYRLPWGHETSMQVTQDCNDACCSDHVGLDKYAWDFANGGSFVVRAARAGTVTHFKILSTTGCGSIACENDVNLIVVDHGDGTQATYMHLKGDSAEPGITCGAHVDQGQPLATSGTTGWSSGVHLHFQVNAVHEGAPTCECGADGKQCPATMSPYASMWCDGAHPTLPIDFDEWPASQCNDRRGALPAANE